MQQESKNCQNCKREFLIEPRDFVFYEKIQVPPPTFCPECRLQRRLAFSNERALYKRACDKCKKQGIAIYSPDKEGLVSRYTQNKEVTVYCQPCWWGDTWDATEYGTDVDFSKPFLSQVQALLKKIPMVNLHSLYATLVNSEYTHMADNLKNCYLTTRSNFDENCAYGSCITRTKDSVDNFMLDQCELMYESVNCQKCYRTMYSLDCENCRDVMFSRNCVECSDCFGCVNLRNKQYYIFNEPYTKEQHEAWLDNYRQASPEQREALKAKAYETWMRFPQKYMHASHSVNVSGDYISNSTNTQNSFLVSDVQDSRYCFFVTPGGTTDCYDFTHYGETSNLLYEAIQVGPKASGIRFSWWIVGNVQECEYSMFLVNCSNCFGCVGLKRKQYCIFNKQYSKEEYEKLRKRIISQMNENPYRDTGGIEYRYGEFFPIGFSPFAYNESTAQEFFPLVKEQAKEKGYGWKEAEQRDVAITMASDKLPDSIGSVDDSILKETIGCEHEGTCNEGCTQAFRIVPQELKFYKEMDLPLPRLCPNCRHYARLKLRNSVTLWLRTCQCNGKKSAGGVYENQADHAHQTNACANEFQTSYSPEREEIVYCEQCYQQEIL